MSLRRLHSDILLCFLFCCTSCVFPSVYALATVSLTALLNRNGRGWREARVCQARYSHAQAHTNSNHREEEATSTETSTLSAHSVPAPVYITIGPPCCGKSWGLKCCLERDGYDPHDILSSKDVSVSLDEQAGVYQRVPLEAFIYPTTHLDPVLGKQKLKSGVSIKERLLKPSPAPLDSTDAELRNIILRVAGRITAQDFADRTRELAVQAGDTVKFFRKRRQALAEDLIKAVETVSAQAVGEALFQREAQIAPDASEEDENELPYDHRETPETKVDLPTTTAPSAHLLSARTLIQTPHVDLFVPQGIFNGGIDRAKERLQEILISVPLTTPVVWGNTNTRPEEYASALSAAQRARRPVKFIAWGTPHLPRVSRGELLRSNVERFRATGRYIPAGAVGAALGRVERIVKEAEKEARKMQEASHDEDDMTTLETDILPHDMNIAFAGLAGFLMDSNGLVAKVGEPKVLNPNKKKKLEDP